jgi:ABC-2 type transport system ATP-binding protein
MINGMEPEIVVSRVCWTPDQDPVLQDFELQVPAGQVRGVLGEKASGRTALIRVLLGLVRPDSGTARVLSRDCWTDAVALHRLVSSRPNLAVWPTLTGGETLAFLHRLAGDTNPTRCRTVLERFGVDPDIPVDLLGARGMSVLSLAATFCRPARVFLVDDAVLGLEPEDHVVLAGVLAEVVERSGTVLLTGRPGDGTAELCDDIDIMERRHHSTLSNTSPEVSARPA